MFLILLTAFLEILGVGILIPVLPEVITYFGQASEWGPFSQWFFSLGMFAWGLVFGKLSDSYGRKNTLILTTLLNLIGYIILIIALSHSITLSLGWILFLVARVIGGVGGAGFSVVQAYISDISSPADRAKNMGMMGAAFGFAFLIGPAIGGVIGANYGVDFVGYGCITAIIANLLSIVFFLKEPTKHLQLTEDHTKFHFSPVVIVLLTLSAGSTFAFSAVQSGTSQFYHDVFGFDAHRIGYTLSFVGVISIIYQGGLVRHIRKYINEVHMMILGFIAMILGLTLFSLNTDPVLVYGIIFLFPLAMGSIQPSVWALMAGRAGREVGKVMGYNTAAISLANLFGPFFVGLTYAIRPSLPFSISAIIASFLLIGAMSLRQMLRKS